MKTQSIVAFGVAALVVTFGLVPQFERIQELFPPETQDWVSELVSFTVETGQVTRVIDGDTIEVEGTGNVRLIGIDTPETKDPRKPVECYGQEASDYMKELVEGKVVELEFDTSNTKDRYNRTLAYIRRLEDNLDVNAEMLRQGYAKSYRSIDHRRIAEYNSLEDQASEQGIGLWDNTICKN